VLSYRDVEYPLAERGLDVSYETGRRWVLTFGPLIARELRRRRAVDDEGEILDMLVRRRRDQRAAIRLMRKVLKKQGFAPMVVTTDKLRSYSAAFRNLGLAARHEQGIREKQSSGMLTPSCPATREEDAGLQVAGVCATFPRSARFRLPHLQHLAAPDIEINTTDLPSAGHGALAHRNGDSSISPLSLISSRRSQVT
jgi:hypothetical protein